MGFMTPAQPELDVESWRALPHPERVRLMCATWAMQGFGAPAFAYLFYVVKIALYVAGFLAFAGVHHLTSVRSFEKAVLWTMLWESLGLGCGSGPLTGRYLPPITAVTHWLRPGTIRLPPWPRLPLTRGTTRTPVDVLLFLAFVVLDVRALLCDDAFLPRGFLIPIIAVMVVIGLRDKTVLLAARSEHYLLATFVFLFPGDLIAGSKAVQCALWFGAATSKLNHHFPNVIAVMMSNNPFLRSRKLRAGLYRSFPDDMRGSRFAAGLGHGATVVEYGFPLVLLTTHGGLPTTLALIVMCAFHGNILLSFPMGVPLEWNVFFIYSALTLFGEHSHVALWSLSSPVLIAVLIVCCIGLPVLGNLRPDLVSFLPSMRYYAGNWAVGVWLFTPGGLESLDGVITKTPKSPRAQLEKLYGPPSYEVIVGRLQAFRSMHVHGRAINALIPLAVADLGKDVDDFEVIEGELVTGLVLGWNFGDGHLGHEQLLAAVQERRGFAPGEVRCVFLESQPALDPLMRWRIVDAATGLVSSGSVRTTDLLDVQPWGGAVPLAVD